MGLEFVELTLRLEQRFDICIDDEAWARLGSGRKPFDVAAGEISALVEAQCARWTRIRHRETDGRPVLDHDVWPGVRDEIAEQVGVRPEQVRPDSWLVRDLGMSF